VFKLWVFKDFAGNKILPLMDGNRRDAIIGMRYHTFSFFALP